MAVLSFNLLGDTLRDALDPHAWSAGGAPGDEREPVGGAVPDLTGAAV
jgi:hypothetical protein